MGVTPSATVKCGPRLSSISNSLSVSSSPSDGTGTSGSGSGVLRPDHFALLPIGRWTLSRGLLTSVFVSIASGVVLLALLAASVHAVLLDPVTLVVAHPIVRDPFLSRLSWHCTAPDGGVQHRLVNRGSTSLGEWPAPFPRLFELDVDPND